MTYDDVNHLSAKIKPKQQRVNLLCSSSRRRRTWKIVSRRFPPPVKQVELEMAIDATSPNYCRSKGEQIALNVDGAAYDETSTYSTYVGPQISLSR